MPINRKVTAKHICAAANFWDANPGYGGFKPSRRYDVIVNGKFYPPKAIVSISHEIAGFNLMTPASFAGAKDGRWHKFLKEREFLIVPKGLYITERKEIGESATIIQDIQSLEEHHPDNPTERETLALARIGQGKYRRGLLILWDGKCAVTACSVLPALRASHAKRWSDSSDRERIDSNNGLLLVANLDALFDAGLIGFDENGKMHISKELKDKKLLSGIPKKLRKHPTTEQAHYLSQHLCHVFQNDPF